MSVLSKGSRRLNGALSLENKVGCTGGITAYREPANMSAGFLKGCGLMVEKVDLVGETDSSSLPEVMDEFFDLFGMLVCCAERHGDGCGKDSRRRAQLASEELLHLAAQG